MAMKKFSSRINGTERTLQRDDGSERFILDGEPFAASVSQITPGRFSIVLDGASLDVRVMPVDAVEGGTQYLVHVEEEEFIIDVADPRKWRRGGGAAQLEGAQRITAPMPGKVVRVLVSEGQAVEAGQGLIVVEAMKMQNEIKSPKAGSVGKVSAAEGQTVAAGQPLLVIE
jgi:biotin carboxyl carrier protein